MNNKLVVGLVVGLSVIAFVVGAFWYQGREQQAQVKTIESGEAKLVRNHSPSIGSPLYRVSLVEFLDPECESCRRFHPIVKDILKKYEDRIFYVVRYAPFHQNSKQAVAFLEAARLQDKYWETLDLLFERLPEWANHHSPKPEVKWTYLAELGLDEEKMRRDVNLPAIQEMIELDIKDVEQLGVRGTPTFFINGEPLARFGEDYLRQAVDEAF